ncbi:efflux RND transporter periplasmic adaptor subunit [Uliginosibacterium gangwonense]|uniref:efflux RND transporter periplasmic adaptor subunit n=1 Tax=Uliginosibacterium gangwonense TaxID=392736 RepID=UPI0003728B06|nr:efflux RND transporter periplasmic adaptor subunit [Uliginosibacterium gangwonense]
MKPRYWGILFAAVLVVGIGLVIAKRAHKAPAPVQAQAEQVFELAKVDLVPVVDGPLARTVSVSGLLQPLRQTLLTAELEGRIDEVMVRAGDKVEKNQVLARMNPEDLDSRVAEARANLAAAKAQLELADRTQKRNEELMAKGFISANSLDNSRNTLDAAREGLRAREAQLALTQQALPKAVIRATLKGVVAERNVEVGQHVGMNTRLFSVVDLTELEFAAKVPVSEISAMTVGQTVSLTAEGSEHPVEGRIERISPVADDASRMIPLYIRVMNRDQALKGGMVVRGNIVTAGRVHTLSISDQAIRDDNGKPWVYCLTRGHLERRNVELGIRDEVSGRIEVRSGLVAGEQVLLARVPLSNPAVKVTVR